MSRKVKISFEGLNLSRTVRELSRQFSLSDVFAQGRKCEFIIDSNVLRQVVAFLEKRCYNITKVQKIGGNFVLDCLRRHFLAPLIFFLTILMLIVTSNFCLKVEISGDFSSAEVSLALEDCGISVGSDLFGFSADVLENSLATRLDAMYVVVTRKGSALYVNAVKKKTVDEPVDMRRRRDIVATCDGKVLSVLCEQGTAAVTIGDDVRAGDTLIFGLRTFNDGTSEEVYALGKVVLQQSAEGFAEFSGTKTEVVETGNVFRADAVTLFGKSYGKMPSFENFRIEETQTSLSPLNIVVRHITYFEVRTVTQTATLEECLDDLQAQAYRIATQNADFLVKYATYRSAADGVYATVYGEATME